MLPGIDGFRILECLRAAQPDTRVLMLSALDNTRNKIEGLNLGADDYLTKPFDFDELRARIHALSRRGRIEQCDHYEISDLIVNTRTQHVERAGKRIELSAREFMLLKFLLEHKDEIVTRTMIAQHVWNPGFEGETNIIDVYINYLRRKPGDGEGNRLIHTIRGRGYMLSEAP
jgi:two-component system, OmpR family, copper resistance phosphate regulon response regulator CusR